VRLYPYFFPDVFRSGGDPLTESVANWVKIRRALLRKTIDRIGYGGYLSLAAKFPEFVEHVAGLCEEFRTIKEHAAGRQSWKAPIRVAVLNAWGKWRSWIPSAGSSQKFLVKRPDVTQIIGSNLLECLAGLPVEVEFMSFADIEKKGVPDGVDVIVNDGDAGTAWSGGRHWTNPAVVSRVREWVHKGGGFLGARGPSAHPHQGRYFQLADVLGVDREVGNSIEVAPVRLEPARKHFITDDAFGRIDFGTDASFVFACDPKTTVLDARGGHVMLAAHEFGRGRSVYLAGLPYSIENSRLLLRALFWVSRRESELQRWLCSNLSTDCAAYPESGCFVVVNNAPTEERTLVYDGTGASREVVLGPCESRWFDM
jgi:1,3-beta-galactosyl-N-acetylhexosamine phosphorylase